MELSLNACFPCVGIWKSSHFFLSAGVAWALPPRTEGRSPKHVAVSQIRIRALCEQCIATHSPRKPELSQQVAQDSRLPHQKARALQIWIPPWWNPSAAADSVLTTMVSAFESKLQMFSSRKARGSQLVQGALEYP